MVRLPVPVLRKGRADAEADPRYLQGGRPPGLAQRAARLPPERDAGGEGSDGGGEAGEREVLEDARADVRAPDRAVGSEVRGVGKADRAQSRPVEERQGVARSRCADREGQLLRAAGRRRGNALVL